MDRKKISRAPPKAPKRLSADDLADCRALDEAIRRYNHGLPESEQITNVVLSRAGARYGGSRYKQQWSAYRNGRRPIPFIDKMIVALLLDRTPQEMFRWLFERLTRFRPSRGDWLIEGQGRLPGLPGKNDDSDGGG